MKLTPEQLAKELKRRGLESGKWEPIGGKEFEPSFVKEHKELLQKLKAVLEAQVEADQSTLERLELSKKRLRRGGGS